MTRYAPLFSVCADEASLTAPAVKAVLDDAKTRKLIAVIPPALKEIDQGFTTVALEIVAPHVWRVRHRAGLQTLRFDETDALRLDWNRSEGVLGVGRVNASLYVTLDPAVDAPVVALTDTPWEPPPFPVLVESHWMLSAMERDWSQLTVDVDGLGTGEMVWSAPPSSLWEIRLTTQDGRLQRYAAQADEHGIMSFALPPLAGRGATLELLREDVSGPGP